MITDTVKSTISSLQSGNDYFRFGYITFNNKLDIPKKEVLNKPFSYSYGAFGIKKSVFLEMNGFEPWLCASDGEFFWRIQSNNYKISLSKEINILYRRHDTNLTLLPSTGMKSLLRKKYHNEKKYKIERNLKQPLKELVISNSILVDDLFYEKYLIDSFSLIKEETDKEFSIIIPTYKNVQYIDKCLESITKSIGNINCEVLIGIDACEETLTHLKYKIFDNRFSVFYFKNHAGPYIIKNTLSKIANSNIILFFDSDDIMCENMIEEIISKQKDFDVVRLMYFNFKNEYEIEGKNTKKTSNFGDGVFSIKKDVFLSMNGFEGWVCEADTDFMSRLYKNNRKIALTSDVVFFRRVHKNSLTQRKDTGIGSSKRSSYNSISRNRKHFGPLPVLTTGSYYEVYVQKTNDEFNEQVRIKIEQNKEIVKLLTERVKKHTTNINYDFLNHVINKKEVYNPNTSKRPIRENIPVNRNDMFEVKKGSLADISLRLSNQKPKRRTDNTSPNPRNKKGGSYYL
jgi:glycosyltransferase involved in cell wall biosynthesis